MNEHIPCFTRIAAPAEMDQARNWLISHFSGLAAQPPFSFVLGGQPSERCFG